MSGVVKTYAFYTDKLPKIYLYKTIYREGGWGHGEVRKPNHLLTLVIDGGFTVKTEGKTYELKTGEVFFIPKDTPYSLESTVPFLHTVFHFDADICDTGGMQGENERGFDYFLFPKRAESSLSVRSDIERASVECVGDTVFEAERRLTFLNIFLGLSKLSYNDKKSELAEKIKSYITSRIDEGITLEDLCRHFAYTKQYLIRVFKKETGKTPIAFMNEIKLNRSINELLNSCKPIFEIAAVCGFEDYNYFSRIFKRQFGMSPGDYRRKYFII